MELRVKTIGISTRRPMVLLNESDAKRGGILDNDRVKMVFGKKSVIAVVDTTGAFIAPGEVGVLEEAREGLGVKNGDVVSISLTGRPESFNYLEKKMRGEHLTRDEIYRIIQDIVNRSLGDLEIAAFLMSEQFYGMTGDEVEYLTKAMVKTGTIIDFKRPVFDKHSIGGVPGNKVSLLIVPIVAAAGLLIPKTSSRAITSPSGTADTMAVLAPVEFTAEELKEIATKVGGTIVWGGKLNLAPADDIMIRVEYPLNLDPPSQMLASIMAKKMAVGANGVVIDIPVGPGTKVGTVEDGRKLANRFVDLGERLKIRIQCGITYGGQPVGHAVGPALEAREALLALNGKGPSSLIEKSTALAGLLLEIGGVASYGSGKSEAERILKSGKALTKMREIIEAQGGDPRIKPEDIPVGKYTSVIRAPCNGYVTHVDNASISAIAKAAGAPVERGAGVVLHWKRGSKVKRDDVLLEIFAERETRLSEACRVAQGLRPVTIEGMLLRRYPEY